METTDTSKRKVQRSAAYPALTLSEAIDFTKELSLHFTDKQSILRADIAAVLGKSEGTIVRDVAAAVQFGLIVKDTDGYRISQLFKNIQNPISSADLFEGLVDSFSSPKLYKELIEKFDGHVVPKELRTHLVRFHSIADKAADSAAEIFFESAKTAGVLSSNGMLNIKTTTNTVEENDNLIIEDTSDDVVEEKKVVLELPAHNEVQSVDEKLPIRLTDGKHAYLTYPSNLSKKDIKILRKQIDVLEVYVSDDEE
ncbi:MAG: hypothetical protein ABJG41_16230 [Cyclobacteriaceae bacterium]